MQGGRAGLAVIIGLALAFPAGAFAADKPNLKVTELGEPQGPVTAGDSFEVSDTTANRGRRRARASVTRYYLSADADRDNGDSRLDRKHQVPRLRPKKSHDDSGSATVPAGIEPGSYRLIACADATKVVGEKNESDNCTTSSGQIVVEPSDTDADGVVDADDNCVTVANAGQADADADGKGDACDPCPAVPNPGSQGCPTTVYAINQGSVTSGSAVRLSNVIVQGVDTSGTQHTWIAEPQGGPAFAGFPNSGLELARPAVPVPPSLGDNITVDGTLSFVSGRPLVTPTAITLNSTGNAPNPPYTVTTSSVAAATTDLHGLLVRVLDVTVVDVSGGDWILEDNAIVDDEIFTLPSTSAEAGYTSIAGIARSSSAGTLAPRFAGDIVMTQ